MVHVHPWKKKLRQQKKVAMDVMDPVPQWIKPLKTVATDAMDPVLL